MVPGAPFVVGSKSLTAGRYRLSCTQLKSAAEAEEACMRLARAVLATRLRFVRFFLLDLTFF